VDDFQYAAAGVQADATMPSATANQDSQRLPKDIPGEIFRNWLKVAYAE
jgi:hypothetical protein